MDQVILNPPQSVEPIPQASPPPIPQVEIKKPINPLIFIILAVLLLTFGGTAMYFLTTKQSHPSTTSACTIEAKLCPDGTSVGRSGPNCEFVPCPSPKPIQSVTPVSASPTATFSAPLSPLTSTYKNDIYHFSIQLPNDWMIATNTATLQADDIVVFQPRNFASLSYADDYQVNIKKHASTSEPNIESWLSKQPTPAPGTPDQGTFIPQIKSSKFGVQYGFLGGLQYQKYLFIANHSIIEVVVNYTLQDNTQDQALRSVYDRMLQSLAVY